MHSDALQREAGAQPGPLAIVISPGCWHLRCVSCHQGNLLSLHSKKFPWCHKLAHFKVMAMSLKLFHMIWEISL